MTKNHFGFPRRMLAVYKAAAVHLAKAEEQIKHVTEAYIELEKAIEILDEAALQEMRTQRMEDYLKRGRKVR